MLKSLNISNFAVFENESINFEKGFNVFTGETGSGKSVFIEAISLILGERASKDLIRKGKKSAFIEAIFDVSQNYKLNEILNKLNVQIDENDFLIISREIFENGKTINKINGRTFPLGTLKELGYYLIDIYGQFGHEKLFKKENHIILLDSLIQKEINPILEMYNKLLKDYNKKNDEIKFLQEKLINKDLKLQQLEFELNEIDNAELHENEEENLLREIKKLSNIQEIKSSLYDINNLMSQNSNSIINSINNVYSILTKISNYDDSFKSYLNKFEILLEEIQYLNYDIIDYSDNLDIDEERLDLIENRVSQINRLKRKYGYSYEKIIEYRNSAEKELKLLKEAESNLLTIKKQQDENLKQLNDYAENISQIRKKAANFLETEITKELNDLNMKNINFKVKIDKNKEFNNFGFDCVEFLISTNIGSDLNSVQKVVSGGEASRIMLAFKKINSDLDMTETMVFDEIDSGISGKTSQMAGVKMNFISKKHQIICVTHSPQIASISKNHYLIEKNIIRSNTYSTVKKLSDKNKVVEIARLLSGMKITEKSLSNAKELIEFNSSI